MKIKLRIYGKCFEFRTYDFSGFNCYYDGSKVASFYYLGEDYPRFFQEKRGLKLGLIKVFKML
jgi:hypothetical protein